jgi:hypothetical protein
MVCQDFYRAVHADFEPECSVMKLHRVKIFLAWSQDAHPPPKTNEIAVTSSNGSESALLLITVHACSSIK